MTSIDPKDEIVTHIPALRAFALSLTRNGALADDLVQDALEKGWLNLDKYAAGTNMRAWLFTILRNTYFSDRRKAMREVAFDDAPQQTELSVLPEHDGRLAVGEFHDLVITNDALLPLSYPGTLARI